MREWTSEQYDSAANINWELSLQPLRELMDARSKDWLPIVSQDKHSAYFNHDMLHLLWQRYHSRSIDEWEDESTDIERKGTLISELYRSHGNREAALLVELDVNISPSTLIQSYSDLQLCAEAYIKLLDTSLPDSQKIALAEEALRRYPKYERINEVRNILNSLLAPYVEWKGNGVYYPEKQYTWVLEGKNATGMTIEVYRLPDSFRESQLNSIRNAAAYLRSIGRRVETMTHRFVSSSAKTEDSITWLSPASGHYALLFAATTDEKEAVSRRMDEDFRLIDVSRLHFLYRICGEQMEVIVADAETGHPVPSAVVSLLESTDYGDNAVPVETAATDDEGRALLRFGRASNSRLYLQAAAAGDTFLPRQQVWQRASYGHFNDSHLKKIELYTDRAIYRPGQTVHVGGIVYEQEHWDATTLANQEYELILRDANQKEVARQTVSTDAMGVLAADFQLPVGRLSGVYRIQTNRSFATFRVEEYKRPTFEVCLDEAPALQWPEDSITLTGRALGYNGVPVRDGNVSAYYQFTYPYWWYRHSDSPRRTLPPVTTDQEGRFAVKVPLTDLTDDVLRHGLNLRLEVEVLNGAGETRQATGNTSLCITPLRLALTIDYMQDREKLTSPQFQLLSSTGRPAKGIIRWSIAPASPEPCQTTPSGMIDSDSTAGLDSLVEAMKALPSGEYELRAFAQAGTDTASAKRNFVVFGFNDTQLVSHQDLWLYCPDGTFSADHSGKMQVGSSLNDVNIFWRVVAADAVRQQGILHITNELTHLEIPYSEAMGDGATVYLTFIKEGKVYNKSQTLRRVLSENELRWQWTSFRDRVHPGDTETWTLRITQPDGSPAPANLMATVYDASLDAIAQHSWNLELSRFYNITNMPWMIRNYYTQAANKSFYFQMKTYAVTALRYDKFDPLFLDAIAFHQQFRHTGLVMSSRKVSRATADFAGSADELSYNAPLLAAAPQSLAATTEAAMENDAGNDEEVADEEDAEETIGAASASVRTNFNETAYFAPRLHTDEAGCVSLHFTLPQSLTTWQMLGVAHTSDLKTASIEAKAVAHKELMAHLNMPRFLRSGDEGSINAAIQNLTGQKLTGKAVLEFFDPETDKVLKRQKAGFSVDANGETVLSFDYTPDDQFTIVGVRLTADTRDFSDGEQYLLPILPDKTYVTESVEIRADSAGVFTTDLTSLFNHDAASATNRILTVEYTTHPIWTVVQSLPALREPLHDDVLSLTCAFYANVLAAHIAATTPRLRQVIELWQAQRQQGTAGLESPLADDEELKQLVLDETPWLHDAMADTERMAQIVNLFDADQLEAAVGSALQRIQDRQQTDGGFSWFPGMRSSELMTRLVAIYLTQLRSLTDDFASLPTGTRQDVNDVLKRAVGFVAEANAEAVKNMKKAEAKGETVHTGSLMHLHYIYISQRSGTELTSAQQSDVRYLLDHLKGTVAGMDNHERAVAALVLKTAGRREWQTYYNSLREHITATENHGSYFDYAGGSFTPTGHKLMVHTAAIEAVAEVDADNRALLSGLRRWLLQQKRTQMWESSICTVNAIHALLHGQSEVLAETRPDELTLSYGKRKVKVSTASSSYPDGQTAAAPAPAALGYIKTTYTNIQAPGSITVRRENTTEAWGAVYASYLTPYADASASSTGLSVRRTLSSTAPKAGDRITTRYVITADRDYEYVCLSADHAACAEPALSRSGFRYQGGLGYYMAMHDARTDYFFDHLPKGTYVLEETAYIDRRGRYTTGLVRIQCLYAPEFGGKDSAVILPVCE